MLSAPVLPVLFAALAAACTAAPPPDRVPGERTPLTAACDPADPLRCGLPWPSDTFTVADATTSTRLRVAATVDVLAIEDELEAINGADGFSVVNPIVTAFPKPVDVASLGGPTGGALRLFVAEPGTAFAREEPLGFRVIDGLDGESLVVAYPKRPLPFSSEHLVVVTDSLRFTDGSAPAADRVAQLSAGLAEPQDEDERTRVAHTAPTRSILGTQAIDPSTVVRTWSFTTRSSSDVQRRLVFMKERAVAAAATATVTFADVQKPVDGPIAAIVVGELHGLPSFRATVPGPVVLDQNGIPVEQGTTVAPFRVVIPKGEGSYRAVLYGHGTAGNVGDKAFDTDLAATGYGKVGVRFDGWTDDTVVVTFGGFARTLRGVRRSTGGLMQSLADLAAIEAALTGRIADALEQPTWDVDGTIVSNPAAGRRIDVTVPVWTGGSLGGTMGFVHANLSGPMRHAVLNVPGAAWTHFLPQSEFFDGFLPLFLADYRDPVDLHAAIAMSQLAWDDVDGANYVPDDAIYLVQQSIGDPVLPAVGSELLAASIGAKQLGEVLRPVVGVEPVTGEVRGSTLTQFKTDATGPIGIHGFADTDRPAGRAARQQIADFIASVYAGDARASLPAMCVEHTPANSCDFSASGD